MPDREVWFVNNCAPHQVGGVETCCRQWAKALHQQGYWPHWLYPEAVLGRNDTNQVKPPECISDRPLAQMPIKRGGIFPSREVLTGFTQSLKDNPPRAIVFNGIHEFNLPLLWIIDSQKYPNSFMFLHGQPFLRSNHTGLKGLGVSAYLHTIHRATMHFLNRRTQPVVVARHLQSHYDALGLNRQAEVCYPVASPDPCGGLEETAGVGPANRSVTTVSRISPEKGMTYLGDLLKNIAPQLPDVSFNLVGPYHNPAFGLPILERITQSGAQYLGPLYGEDLCRHYSDSGLLLMPSPAEGFPLVMIEALSHGVPVLARNIGATQEMFGCFNQPPGFLLPFDAPAAATPAIEYINAFYANPSFRGELVARAQEARNLFNPNRLCQNFVDLVAH